VGANQNSIGVEHVGSETDSLTAPQTAASAALIRWLLEQYHIPRTNIFWHDLHLVIVGRVERAAVISFSAQCTHKEPSLPGWKPTCKHQTVKPLVILRINCVIAFFL
jgi:hypothetical protein